MQTTTEKTTVDQIREIIERAQGTEQLHRWSGLFRNCYLSDSLRDLCETAGAYWLADLIASHLPRINGLDPEVREAMADFHIWELHPYENSERFSWIACASDGNLNIAPNEPTGRKLGYLHQKIEYSDFPLPEGLRVYVSRVYLDETRTGYLLMLPGDY